MRANAFVRSMRPNCAVSSTNKPIPPSHTLFGWKCLLARRRHRPSSACNSGCFPPKWICDFQAEFARRLSVSLQAAGLQTAEAPCRILRHPRQHEPQRFLAKARRDLALASAEAEACGDWSPRLLLAAGQAHCVLGDQDQAREMLRRAADSSPPRSAHRLEAFYGLLTTFDDDPDLHASQLTACLDSLEDFPFDLQLLLALGNYMLVRERLDLAIRAFEAAVRFGRITPTVWHLCEVREIAAICLGACLAGPTTRRRSVRRLGGGAGRAAGLAPLAPSALQSLPQSWVNRRKPWPWPSGCLLHRRPSARIGGRPGKTGGNCASMRAGLPAIWRRTSPPASRSPSANKADYSP